MTRYRIRIALTSIFLGVVFLASPWNVRGYDLGSIRWAELIGSSETVCTARLVAIREIPGKTDGVTFTMGELEFMFELNSRLSDVCVGTLPQRRALAATYHLLRAEIGSSWVLFVRREPKTGEWQLVDWARGIWRLITVKRRAWKPGYITVIAPDSLNFIHGLPEELFDHEPLRLNYFGTFYVDFKARVVRLEKLAEWLKENKP